VTVLLLEAGGSDDDMAVKVPLACNTLQGTERDWQFRTEPQQHSHRMYNGNQSKWPRGKTLGGSSSINYMM
jgi:choline dehydrogenase